MFLQAIRTHIIFHGNPWRMNRGIFTILGLSCLAIFMFAPSLQGQEQAERKTITVATGEWAPWTGEDLPHNGFVCRVVEDVFNRAGYDVVFEFYPWQRAYAMVAHGRVDASAYWYESEKRKEDCYYSDPLTREEIVLFHLKTKPMKDWESLADLEGYRIGVSRGNTYTDRFWELGEQGMLTMELADSDLANFRKLLAGRIDIFPCSNHRGYTLLATHFPHDAVAALTHHETPLAEQTGHILFPKAKEGSLRLLQVFNEYLSRLKADGTYRRYIEALEYDAYDR